MPAKSIGRSHGLCTLQCQGGSDMPRGCMSSVHETMPLSMRKSETRMPSSSIYRKGVCRSENYTRTHTTQGGALCRAVREMLLYLVS
jgi:hypothetical protein